MNLPVWLTEKEKDKKSGIKGSAGKDYVDKTLFSIAQLTEGIVFSEKYANRKGLLQGINPKIKLAVILLLVVVTSFLRSIESILVVYALALFLALASRIDISFFIKRVWFFIPIFSGIIAFPSIFNVFIPGEPLLTFIKLDHGINLFLFNFTELSITREGLLGAILFVSRVATSVSLVVLLTLTTKWNDIMKSLRAIYVPFVFVLILSMTYQYILILIRMVEDMHYAKKSRTIRRDNSHGGLSRERDWVASRIGTVLMKSYYLSEETHSAMVSRGFNGEFKS